MQLNDDNDAIADFVVEDIPVGYYIMDIILHDGSSRRFEHLEDVTIYNNEVTYHTVSIPLTSTTSTLFQVCYEQPSESNTSVTINYDQSNAYIEQVRTYSVSALDDIDGNTIVLWYVDDVFCNVSDTFHFIVYDHDFGDHSVNAFVISPGGLNSAYCTSILSIQNVQNYYFPVYRYFDTSTMSKGPAINGYDPVAYFTSDSAVPGDSTIVSQFADEDWYFASEYNRCLFERDPERFVPKFGGYCTWSVSKEFEAKPNPEVWWVNDDKLYLFFSRGVKRVFLQDLEKDPTMLDELESKWKLVRKDIIDHRSSLEE